MALSDDRHVATFGVGGVFDDGSCQASMDTGRAACIACNVTLSGEGWEHRFSTSDFNDTAVPLEDQQVRSPGRLLCAWQR